MLFDRINDEYTAHYFYRNVSNYCENVGFTNAAKFFKKESDDELVHARGLEDYLVGWNIQPELKPLKSPEKVSGLPDAIKKSYEIEYALYEEYESISKKIFQKDDLCTFDFLKEYRTIQRTSVAEYATLLNKLELIDSTNKNWIFNFENEVFG